MRWNLPNILTLLRLLAAPGVPLMFLYFHRPWADWAALALFMGAAITDWIDGYLARAWKQESRFGAAMDPIADKAMVVIALVVITGYSGMNPWLNLPVTIILFREVFVSGLREYLGDKSRLLAVTKLAKWKTTLQMVALGCQLFARNWDGWGLPFDYLPAFQLFSDALIWLAAIVTLWTGWQSFSAAQKQMRDL